MASRFIVFCVSILLLICAALVPIACAYIQGLGLEWLPHLVNDSGNQVVNPSVTLSGVAFFVMLVTAGLMGLFPTKE